MSAVLQQGTRGLWLKRDKDASVLQTELHELTARAIIEAVGACKGGDAARILQRDGLGRLHLVVDAQDISEIRDIVLDRLRTDLLRMAVDVGRRQLGWSHEFFIDDYIILRINFPYEVARHASVQSENPGIGRLSIGVREVAASRRVKDPLFDPKSYHRGHPPAAWAHGPHLDSWSGHSKDGLNLWWAIGDVPHEASMVLYPSIDSNTLACDRRTLYLQSGIALPTPTFVPLEAGDLLIFDPEILHGTHLNVTDQTRVAISLRLNKCKPTFDPECFYAREFWRSAVDIEDGDFDRVLHLKREEHLAANVCTERRSAAANFRVIQATSQGHETLVVPSEAIAADETVLIEGPDRRIMISRAGAALSAYLAACPHYGVDLSDGSVDGLGIYCPACAVKFDLLTGTSSCSCLSLTMFEVGEANGCITVVFSPDAGVTRSDFVAT